MSTKMSADVEYLAVKAVRQEIIKHDLQIKALIQDIRECLGPEEDLDLLNATVREKMQILRKQIQELETLAREQDTEAEKIILLKEVENHSTQANSTQMALRKANVTARMTIDKLNRDALIQLPSTDTRRRQKRDKEDLLKTSTKVTDSLLAVSQMISNQVQQSEHVLQNLVGSSKTLSENQEEFKTMGSVIQQSHKLLTKYNRREVTDKILIFFALAFFFACVLYVVKKRLFS